MAIDERIYTVDEFEAFQDQHPDRRFELIDGRIIEDVTNEEHGAIAANIGFWLVSWKRANKIACHISYDTAHRVPGDPKNHRRPDISVRLTDEKASAAPYLLEMPTLAVEIKLPSNDLDDLRDKARFYLKHGTQLVWIIIPGQKTVEIFAADGSVQTVTEADTLTGGDALPSFTVSLREIFDV